MRVATPVVERLRASYRRSHPAVALSRAGLVAVLAGAVALSAAGVTPTLPQQAAVYLFGMVALNLPHGGYEQFTNLRHRAGAFRWRYVGAYLLLVGAFLGLFFVNALAGLALAVTVACLKGGHGGLRVLAATGTADHLDSRLGRALAVGARGGAVMLVPIYCQPGVFSTFSAMMVSMFDPAGLAPLAGRFETTRLLAGGTWTVLAAGHVGHGYLRGGGGRSWLVDAGETALLGAYFAVVPVVVAVGLYFPLWYSGRQVARHDAVDRPAEGPDLLGGDDPTAVALRAWAVLVAGAVATAVVVGTIWLAAPNPLGDGGLLPGLVAFWSVSISIVALPHVVVGAWADPAQGIWYVP